MIKKAIDRGNYILSEAPYPTYVFEEFSVFDNDKTLNKKLENSYETANNLVDEANEEILNVASKITSKFETKRNTNLLDVAQELFKISLKEGSKYGFSLILEYDDLYIGGVTQQEEQYIKNHIESYALMELKRIAKEAGLKLFKKANDSEIDDLNKKIKEIDLLIKKAIKENNEKDFVDLSNKRNVLAREIAKIRPIKISDDSMFIGDKIFNQSAMTDNEFFGTIEIAFEKKDPNKIFKVTKNPVGKIVVADDTQIIGTKEANGKIFFDDNVYNMYYSSTRVAKTNPELKAKNTQTLSSPNLNRFPIEEIPYTHEEIETMNRETFRNQATKMFYDIESYFTKLFPENSTSIEYRGATTLLNSKEFANLIKTEFQMLAFNKYGITLSKFIIDGLLKNSDDAEAFKSSLLALIESENNEYDKNLNGLEPLDIIEKYGEALLSAKEKELQDIRKMERKNTGYTVKLIENYQESTKYSKYLGNDGNTTYVNYNRNSVSSVPGAWCVTYGKGHWDHVISEYGGDVFYFLLAPGWDEPKIIPSEEECKKYKIGFDPYGTSMIAVSIKKDGTIYTSTTRWNHGLPNKGSINTDHVYSAQDISNFLGQPWYEVLKPLHPKNLFYEEEQNIIDITKDVVRKGVRLITKGDTSLTFYNNNYYILSNRNILKDKNKKPIAFSKFVNLYDTSKKPKVVIGHMGTIDFENEKYTVGFNKDLKVIVGLRKESPDDIQKLKKAIESENLR